MNAKREVIEPGIFQDRREAGRLLAEKLTNYANRPDVIVLALPRGGVPIAYEVARRLNAPLDVFVVRKLGIPGYEELAMGAVATGGTRILNEEFVKRAGLPDNLIEAVTARELKELARRERLYRGSRPPPDVRGRTVILVDDGLATGATMLAAIRALRQQQPARIVVAVPTASPDTCEAMKAEADDVICAVTPDPFYAVGLWYQDFSQTTDEEVRALLAQQTGPDSGGGTQEQTDKNAIEAVRAAAYPLAGSARDYDPLMERIGDARFALLGEASHGTHEFYRERAEITKRLIAEKTFNAVAVEADWPDAYRVNRYVRRLGNDLDAAEALADFRRFPTWMWRNTVVVEFIEWLRDHNDALPADAEKVGFYGLDLYSLHASMKAVLRYLEKVDPVAAGRARERYSCFDHFGDDAQTYGLMTGLNLSKSCEEEVLSQLVELQRRTADHSRSDASWRRMSCSKPSRTPGWLRTPRPITASMFAGGGILVESARPSYGGDLEALVAHLESQRRPARRSRSGRIILIWAMRARRRWVSAASSTSANSCARNMAARRCCVGFTTYQGTVTAASDWGDPAQRKTVRPAMAGSYEALFHAAQRGRFLLIWKGSDTAAEQLHGPQLERAIGVIYRPETERQSHFFQARLPEQFDAVLHFDETRAVTPLETTAEWEAGEVPETFPFAV